MSRNLYIIARKILALIFRDHNTGFLIDSYLALVTKMLKHHGTVNTVKRLKAMRLHITRYMCGQPLFVNKDGVGVDKSG